jgi:hypothetical protein
MSRTTRSTTESPEAELATMSCFRSMVFVVPDYTRE